MRQVIAYKSSDGRLFETQSKCQEHEETNQQHGTLLLRVVPHITERMGISRSGWWKGVKDGKYPPGIKLSPRVTVWKSSDIDSLIESLGK